ncbi:MAG: glycosyltransferase family 9 protein [Nitrospinae bacterium]|nr:glycosyltransferase family 9 protein [Nitrospinota bacterium]
MNTLIIRTGGLGDTILTLGAAQWLKESGRHVTVMAHGGYREIADLFGFAFIAEEESGFESIYSETSAKLRVILGGFDTIIAIKADMTADMTAGLAKASSGRAFRIAPLPPMDYEKPYSLYLAESIAKTLGIAPPSEPPFPKPLAGWKKCDQLTATIHSGSGSPKKNWPFNNFMSLARTLAGERAARVNIIFGPAELERMEDAVKKAGTLEDVNIVTNPGYGRLAAILLKSSVYIGCDSGVTHLAAALGVPTVALFGPSNAKVWRPAGTRVKIMAAEDGDMESIRVEQVIEAVNTASQGCGATEPL